MTTPTTDPVPSSAPQDLLFNAEKIDEAVSSSAATYDDRLGVSRLTLAGAMSRISAVNTRGAWVTATVYAARDVVSNSGTWYIAVDVHTSGATFAGDLSAHWRVYQGVIASDLASDSDATKGAQGLGIGMTLGYAAANTVAYFLRGLLGRTAAEVSAGVTPSNYLHFPGDVRRYGAVGDDSTDCTTALASAYAQWDAGGAPVYLSRGTYRVTAGHTRTTRIKIHGDGKFQSVIRAIGFASDASIINLNGSSGSLIDCWSISGIGFMSDGGLAARGVTATYAPNGKLSDVYFYDMYRGYVGTQSYLVRFEDVSAYNVQQETYLLGDECNNCTWSGGMIRSVSADGLKATGNMAGLTFVGVNVEGVMSAGKAGLNFAPATGKKIIGVEITGGGYIEKVKGGGIQCDGVDANSVQGLIVKGIQFFGGHSAFFASVAGHAEYALILKNVSGFDVSENAFTDWETAAIFRDGTELNGRVHNNTTYGTAVPALTNSSNQFSASVDARNNFAGRKVESSAAMPTSGSYTQGDYVENRTPSKDGNSMILKGWIRLTTGAAHVLGTDWGRDYASHVTPAA